MQKPVSHLISTTYKIVNLTYSRNAVVFSDFTNNINHLSFTKMLRFLCCVFVNLDLFLTKIKLGGSHAFQ